MKFLSDDALFLGEGSVFEFSDEGHQSAGQNTGPLGQNVALEEVDFLSGDIFKPMDMVFHTAELIDQSFDVPLDTWFSGQGGFDFDFDFDFDFYPSLLSLEVRTQDGTANNSHFDNWGAAGTTLLRLAPASYEDGISDIDMARPNARDISNAIVAQDGVIPNSFGIADIFTYFGQFLDHDIDITPESETEIVTVEIDNDILGDIAFHRSEFVPGSGVTSARQHDNLITSYVDASNIYGSSEEVTHLLRADAGYSPYLIVGANGYAPTVGDIKAEHGAENVPEDLVIGADDDDFYVGGDIRINENIALTTLHTVWIKEHNYQVDKLMSLNPHWSNEQLFHAAKIIVEAEYQNIVFNEYLPLLVGADNIPDYLGYDETVNAGIATEFSTAAFRLGHSQISSILHRTNEDGSTADAGDIGLFRAFFNPAELENGGGIDPLIRGLTSFLGQEIDENIVDDVRNLLFGPPGVGLDLSVLNIMRGRDHGLPTLNDFRDAVGLDRYTDFDDLTSNSTVASQFASVYSSIDEVDLWIGGLAEEKVSGSQLGETFQFIVLDQFLRLRDGDRFYFEDRLKDFPELLEYVEATTFSDILLRNSDVEYLQDDAFIAHTRIGGTDKKDILHGTDSHDLLIGFKGKDKLFGKEGDDDLYGGKGKDTLKGGEGNDLINGGAGRDHLWGGADEDVFVFAKGHGVDKVYDFNSEEDTLDLSDYYFETLFELKLASHYNHRTDTTTIDFGLDQIKLVGVKKSELTTENVILNQDVLDDYFI